MQVRWLGQSAFALNGARTVVVDPFAESERMRARGFAYPPIEGLDAEVVLVTHDHTDHNGVDAIGGKPQVVRAAGRTDTPVGEVLGIASEHDAAAGTERGANVIFVFELDGLRVCHFGDFGQTELRPEQEQAIGRPDLLLIPVGGGPTIGGQTAAAIAKRLQAGTVVPMHYRTAQLDWADLETADLFAAEFDAASVTRLDTSVFDLDARSAGEATQVVVAATP